MLQVTTNQVFSFMQSVNERDSLVWYQMKVYASYMQDSEDISKSYVLTNSPHRAIFIPTSTVCLFALFIAVWERHSVYGLFLAQETSTHLEGGSFISSVWGRKIYVNKANATFEFFYNTHLWFSLSWYGNPTSLIRISVWLSNLIDIQLFQLCSIALYLT